MTYITLSLKKSKTTVLTCWIVLCYFGPSHERSEATFVTFGSVVKLLNMFHGVRLHSLDAYYPEGSNQQMVTGIYDEDDVNSHWVVKSVGDSVRGQPVLCGDLIRLEHLNSGKSLHSHDYRSPLSSKQEVTAYSENGTGARSDKWQVVCKKLLWRRDMPVTIRHLGTGRFLMVSGHKYGESFLFTYGDLEVAASLLDEDAFWEVAEGIYFHPNEKLNVHTEL